MRVLLDANIWLDIAARPSTYPDSAQAFAELQRLNATICLPLSTYTTLYYVLARALSKEAAIDFLKSLYRRNILFLSFGMKEIDMAQSLNFRDHEDACVAAIGLTHHVTTLITRNVKDFPNIAIKVQTPSGFLKSL